MNQFFYGLKRSMKRISLTLRQALAIFFLAFLMIAALQFFNLEKVKQDERALVISDIHEKLNRTNIFLDNYIRSINNLLISLSTRTDIFEENTEAASNILTTIHTKNSDLASAIYILRNGQEILSSNQVAFDIIKNDQLKEILLDKQYAVGVVQASEPYYNYVTKDTLCFILPVDDETIIALEINLGKLQMRLIELLRSSSHTYVLTTAAGNVVTFDKTADIPTKKGVYPIELTEEFLHSIQTIDNHQELVKGDSNQYMICSGGNLLQWNVTSIFDGSLFTRRVMSNYLNLYAFSFLGLLIFAAIVPFVSFYFTKPIRRLALSMEKVQNLDDLLELPTDEENEIARLIQSYNLLIRRIHELIDNLKISDQNKREYELKMLRSQIGSHFLYNTLACIGSLARQERVAEVGQTISCLVNLISFSLDKTSESVSLAEELNGLESYVSIQKIRYGDRFDYQVKLDQEVSQCSILKLTLQPLVENAIFHGIVPKQVRGKIRIRARRKGDCVVIEVTDTGVGVEKEKLKRILNKETTSGISERFSSIGVSNVNERIKLHFGDDFGIFFASKVNLGTRVKIVYPIHLLENHPEGTV